MSKAANLFLYLFCASAFSSSAQTVETILSFNGTDGCDPVSPLVRSSTGDLYGTTYACGTFGFGTVFKIDAEGHATTLHSFHGVSDGSAPEAGLVQAADGTFLGTASNSGPGECGAIFRITKTGEFTLVHVFKGLDGRAPAAALILGSDGDFYGTTVTGGRNGWGTVFRLTAGGDLETLHSFDSTDGANPAAALMEDAEGNFYGTTEAGGSVPCQIGPCGTVFKISPTRVFASLYSFTGGSDGGTPVAALIQGTDGYFYGTTEAGGAMSCGTAFKINSMGDLTTLHSFGGSEGCFLAGALVLYQGIFYGTNWQEGSRGDGTIFSMTSSGTVATLYDFGTSSSSGDGAEPKAPFIQAGQGVFYGTTYQGGLPFGGDGTVFRFTAANGQAQ